MVEKIYANLEIKDDETPSVEDCKKAMILDDWMDDYLELESSTNNDFDLYFNRARERLGMKKDNFKLQYYYGGRIVKINFRLLLGLFEMC
ncbi:hypothetical protein H5410_036615 [Solanum commersonii]|uniref:Uncharacterized protein n=1 Tax=Solanum commersonii TaxID=4109 RepID=A0A9J5Y654_SOLCO|nr:hypothetical protein H5410_036615 [Solanum commersonii]